MCFDKDLRENNRGFTLLELIVTVVILALVAAPFLSSFVSAARTNVESKRQEESNELAQYIIEQFKASSIDYMKDNYGMTETTAAIVDSDLTSGYSKNSKSYKATAVDMSGLTIGSSDYKNYTVDIDLVPIKTEVNRDDAIPSIDGVDREKCLVLVDNLTKFDKPTSHHRAITVVLTYDDTEKAFFAEATIETFDSANNWVSGSVGKWKYEKGVPSVYMLYLPLHSTDKIVVDNQIQSDDYDDFNTAYASEPDFVPISIDKDKVGVYIVNQKANDSSYAVNYDGSYVTIIEHNGAATNSQTLARLFLLNTSKEDANIFDRTVVYSNIWKTTSTQPITSIEGRSDKQDTVNDTVRLLKADTIYNITVTVYHNGKYIAKYESTKTVSE